MEALKNALKKTFGARNVKSIENRGQIVGWMVYGLDSAVLGHETHVAVTVENGVASLASAAADCIDRVLAIVMPIMPVAMEWAPAGMHWKNGSLVKPYVQGLDWDMVLG